MSRYVTFLILCLTTQTCLSQADTCGSCVCPSHANTPSVVQQGRPGKVGSKSEKGDSGIQGDIGPMGQQGECDCGVFLEAFQEVNKKLAELANEKIMMNEKLATLTTGFNQLKGLFTECESSPCKNRATCNENGGGRYTCTCPDGYAGADCSVPCDGLSFDSVCYNLHTTSMTFESARAKCNSLGQRLAEVKTPQTLEAVKEYIRGIKGRSTNHNWIGGSYTVASGNRRVTWEDSSSTVIPSDMWLPGWPSTSSSYSSYTRLGIYVRDTQSTREGIYNDSPTSRYLVLCQST